MIALEAQYLLPGGCQGGGVAGAGGTMGDCLERLDRVALGLADREVIGLLLLAELGDEISERLVDAVRAWGGGGEHRGDGGRGGEHDQHGQQDDPAPGTASGTGCRSCGRGTRVHGGHCPRSLTKANLPALTVFPLITFSVVSPF